MTGSHFYLRAAEVVNEVLLRNPPDFDACACELCGDDEDLLHEVRELLRMHTQGSYSDPLADEAIENQRCHFEDVIERIGGAGVPSLPEFIDRYRVLREIGRGGMGVVYECEQPSPRRRVAVKLVDSLRYSKALERRLTAEAQLLGRLQHPGIAQIFDAGVADVAGARRPYFVMELVAGRPLRKFADAEGISIPDRLALVARIAEAIAHAHERKIVHRDLKHENILVNDSGQPKILDFGIARFTGESNLGTMTITSEGQILGTIGYMAPEQLGGELGSIKPPTDVYALGVILYELIAGEAPLEFGGLSIAAAVRLLDQQTPKPLRAACDSINRDIETVVGKCLEREPGRRYNNAGELAADLRRILGNRPITARPPSKRYRASMFAKRNRALVGGVAATLAVLLAGIIVTGVLARQEHHQRVRADENAREALRNESRIVSTIMRSATRAWEEGDVWDAREQAYSVPESTRSWGWRMMSQAFPELLLDLTPPPQGAVPYGTSYLWMFLGEDRIVSLDHDRGCIRIRSLVDRSSNKLQIGDDHLVGIGQVTKTGLVTAWTPNTLYVVDLNTGDVLSEFGIEAPATASTISDDGALLTLEFNELPSRAVLNGKVILTRERPNDLHTHLVHLAIDPGGSAIFINSMNEVTVLDPATGTEQQILPAAPLSQIAAFPVRGGWISQEWDTDQLHLTRVQFNPGISLAAPGEVVYNPKGGIGLHGPDNGEFAVTTGANGINVVGLSASYAQPLSEYQDQTGFIASGAPYTNWASVSPGGTQLLVHSYSEPPWLIDLNPSPSRPDSDHRCTSYDGHDSFLYHLAVSNDGSLAATLSPVGNSVHVWDIVTGQRVAEFQRHPIDYVSQDALMAFSEDDTALVFTSPLEGRDDVAIIRCDLVEGTTNVYWPEVPVTSANHAPLLDEFIEITNPAPAARLSQKAQMHGQRAITLWRDYRADFSWPEVGVEHSGEHWLTLPQPGRKQIHDVMGLSIHPTLDIVATVGPDIASPGGPSRDGLLTLRRADGTLIREVRLPYFPRCVAFSPDGAQLAIGTNPGRLLIVETEFYTTLLDTGAHDRFIYSLAWLPDGHRLITVSGDASAKIWDDRSRTERDAFATEWRNKLAAAHETIAVGASASELVDLDPAALRIARIERRAHRSPADSPITSSE